MNEAKMGIPLSEVRLPKSGYTVMIYQYLTTGESRELQKVLLGSGSFNAETQKIDSIPTGTFLDMQDKAAEFLIKEYISPNGERTPFNREWLYNLPVDDGSVLYDKVNDIYGASNLSQAQKKN